ncbi:hypothetical protein BABINDRAFT_162964 [Babjeviella inositovora NRRL Y-12698]|uniref:Uncharacterized protein n=1 Tax=Babjeviella inositovora NRRL Y-12698 TaxID=984486 RepID=A0A1E3QLI2_9ASCO|nr:uncharacterized protein BABINDRAFT_162964 [Babjeviella inositovora NRRL Y-12698]ODQ78324.1 hypothetical protein BABINDRAFT_162964 [Babjeviella inositovora NRRL Y-12698]
MPNKRPEPTVSAEHIAVANSVQNDYIKGTYNEEDFQILSTMRYDPTLPASLSDHVPKNISGETTVLKPSAGAIASDKFFLFDEHVKRINFSLGYFHWDYELSAQMLLDKLNAALEVEDVSKSLKLRVMIGNDGKVRIEIHPTPECDNLLAGLTTELTLWEVGIDKNPTDVTPFTSLKTTQRDHYDQSRKNSRIEVGMKRDVIIYNPSKYVMECSISNVAFVRKHENAAGETVERWVTPPLVCGCICGTMRSWLLKNGIMEEEPVMVKDIRVGEPVLMFNALMGVVKGKIVAEFSESEA